MALPTCTFCEQNQGVLMATNLADGDTQVACGPCLPGYALGMAAAMTDGMPPEAAEAYAAAFDAIYDNDPRPGKPVRQAPAKRKGGQRAAVVAADAPEAATGPHRGDSGDVPSAGDQGDPGASAGDPDGAAQAAAGSDTNAA